MEEKKESQTVFEDISFTCTLLITTVILAGLVMWSESMFTSYNNLHERVIICSGEKHLCIDKNNNPKNQKLIIDWRN